MRVLSLFAGVGMFDYAFRQLGWETVAFAEMDKWCQRVLEKHHPGVPIYDDVRDITHERLKVENRQDSCGTGNQPTGIDIICGGFPCQDLSVAGKQKGIDGERSGLWSEFARIIGELRPRYVIVENVSALLTGDSGAWMRRVLGDLAEIGFDAEWHVIPAGNPDGRLSAGAPHRRERVWIVGYPSRKQRNGIQDNTRDSEQPRSIPKSGDTGRSIDVAYPGHPQPQSDMGLLAHGIATGLSGSRWLPEPGVGRVATRVPDRVNKLKALGNGLVWQIPYAIGMAIQAQIKTDEVIK